MTKEDIDRIASEYFDDKESEHEMEEVFDLAEKALEKQIQESKTGHWVKYGIPRCGEQHYKCTNCDEYFNFGLYSDYYKKAFKYCPNCGCRIVEPQESEDI